MSSQMKVTFNPKDESQLPLAFMLKSLVYTNNSKSAVLVQDDSATKLNVNDQVIKDVKDVITITNTPMPSSAVAKLSELEKKGLLSSFILTMSLPEIHVSIITDIKPHLYSIRECDIDGSDKIGPFSVCGIESLIGSSAMSINQLAGRLHLSYKDLIGTPYCQLRASLNAFRNDVVSYIENKLSNYEIVVEHSKKALASSTSIITDNMARYGSELFKDFMLLLVKDYVTIDRHVLQNLANSHCKIVLIVKEDGQILYTDPSNVKNEKALKHLADKKEKLKKVCLHNEGKHNSLSLLRIITQTE